MKQRERKREITEVLFLPDKCLLSLADEGAQPPSGTSSPSLQGSRETFLWWLSAKGVAAAAAAAAAAFPGAPYVTVGTCS